MDHVSADDATRSGTHTRRSRMRAQARSHHLAHPPVSDRYQTPEWLERSFVLPLTPLEATDVPDQPVPHHDDDPRVAESTLLGRLVDPQRDAAVAAGLDNPIAPFVRPRTEDIDFARVVRRSDLCRTAGRTACSAAGISGLCLIVYLLLPSAVALGVLLACAAVAALALALRLRLRRAPLPRLQR